MKRELVIIAVSGTHYRLSRAELEELNSWIDSQGWDRMNLQKLDMEELVDIEIKIKQISSRPEESSFTYEYTPLQIAVEQTIEQLEEKLKEHEKLEEYEECARIKKQIDRRRGELNYK